MCAAPKRKNYHHGSLREALLASGRALLESQGIDGLSLRELARRAGVSPNAPYRHFNGKPDLLAAIAEEGFEELTQRFRDCGSFAEMGSAYVDFATQSPNLLRLMFGKPLGAAESYPGLAAASQACFAMLLGGAARTVNLPAEHPKSFQFALASWSLVHGFATLRNDGALAHLPLGAVPSAEALTACLFPPATSRKRSRSPAA